MSGQIAGEAAASGRSAPTRDLRQDTAWLNQVHYSLADLDELTAFLRSPEGCPWDRVQTAKSLRQGFLEEAYEVCDAIDQQDAAALCEELGDVLLNVIFQVQLAEEAGLFDFDAVTTTVCRKLIDRHTYVFADQTQQLPAADQTEALKQWEANKRQEKQQRSYVDTLNGVARALPALRRAQKLQSKAKKAGLDITPDQKQITTQLTAALASMQSSAQADNCGSGKGDTAAKQARTEQLNGPEAMNQAAGSLLFALAGYLSALNVDLEAALDQANQTFIRRFAAMEEQVTARGQQLEKLDAGCLRQLWQETALNRETDPDKDH
ncbi:nucleoside triphosphate pyrophosphohydrolase [Oscillospiraceae bacterium HV4-5-C5C]|nr:nucleoside triphosphate pyrophosphohydrolase [Oscillospiraceae bacterium HV4-5-C5C]